LDRVIVIVGPTAVGKSQYASVLARAFGGEIINADSRQIYRYMNIGTAKPGKIERRLIDHHLFDIINPDESFSLSEYQARAVAVIRDIGVRAKLPFLVGGSGQYIWAVVDNWLIPRVPPDTSLRRDLERKAAEKGRDSLFQELQRVDPEAAARVDALNTRRVIRALEIRYNGQPLPPAPTKGAPLFDFLIIGLTRERQKLYADIDRRVDDMVRYGLFDEVENLRNMGYDFSLPALSAIGYRQVGLFLQGKMDRADAINQIKFETHRYVRQQYNWFKLKNDRIKWFDIDKHPLEGMQALLADFLQPEPADA
jgi:tRNA dimethylallyltransferase